MREHDQFFPGPLSHPYRSVSSCRSEAAFHGDPRIPVVGLPDCESLSRGPAAAAGVLGVPFDYTIPTVDPGLTANDLKAAGIPVPDNVAAPSYGALEESLGIHLQAFRIGPVSFTVCSCEQWAEQSLGDAYSDLNGAASPVLSAASSTDRLPPVASISRGSLRVSAARVLLAGTASDRGGCRAGVRQVLVEVVRRTGGGRRCQYVLPSGALSRPRSCAKPLFLRARGTTRWRLTLPAARLPCGSYELTVVAVDRSGNRERPGRRGRMRFVHSGCRVSLPESSADPF